MGITTWFPGKANSRKEGQPKIELPRGVASHTLKRSGAKFTVCWKPASNTEVVQIRACVTSRHALTRCARFRRASHQKGVLEALIQAGKASVRKISALWGADVPGGGVKSDPRASNFPKISHPWGKIYPWFRCKASLFEQMSLKTVPGFETGS